MRLKFFKKLYRFSFWYNSHFTLIGKTVLFTAMLTAFLGIDVERSTTYQVFGILASLLIISIINSRFVKHQLQCERHLPQLATVGEPFNYHISIKNNTRQIIHNVFLIDALVNIFPTRRDFYNYVDTQSEAENWFDRKVGFPRWRRLLTHKTGALNPVFSAPVIAAEQTLQLQMTIEPIRRGYIHFAQLAVGISDITGLFRKIKTKNCRDKILVLPKRYSIPKIHLPGKRHHNRGGVAFASAVGETNEFQSLRDYRPGDPLRHIHWRSWARSGSPVVKKFDDEFFVRHALILDTYAAPALQQAFEEAVSIAASIAISIESQESLLDLMFVEDNAYHFTTGRHVDDIISLFEILACVNIEPQQSFSALSSLVLQNSHLLSSAICIFLSWGEDQQQLVQSLHAQGIDVMVILVSNPGDTAVTSFQSPPLMNNLQHRFIQFFVGHVGSDIYKLSEIFRPSK